MMMTTRQWEWITISAWEHWYAKWNTVSHADCPKHTHTQSAIINMNSTVFIP